MIILDELKSLLANPYILKSFENDKMVAKETTKKYITGKYTVYTSNSAYVTDLVTTVKGYKAPVYIEFISPFVVHLGFRHNLEEWDQKDIETIFNENLFNEVKDAIATGLRLKPIHYLAFKKYAVWDFNSYDSLVKG